MSQRVLDLAVVLGAESELLAATGQAVLAHQRLPHPLLGAIEDQYPREIARARFNAIWAARDAEEPNPVSIGAQFREELVALFKLKGKLVEPYTLVIDGTKHEAAD
jgi:hypothetical protein